MNIQIDWSHASEATCNFKTVNRWIWHVNRLPWSTYRAHVYACVITCKKSKVITPMWVGMGHIWKHHTEFKWSLNLDSKSTECDNGIVWKLTCRHLSSAGWFCLRCSTERCHSGTTWLRAAPTNRCVPSASLSPETCRSVSGCYGRALRHSCR